MNRKWLKKIRLENGLSQEKLSENAGISQNYYSSIESGIRGQRLPVPTAQRIASVLNFDWRLFYEDYAMEDGNKQRKT
jgi:putative transcriptional regulator